MKYYLKQVFKQQVQQSLSGAEVVCIFGKEGGRFKRSLTRGGCSTDGQAVSGRSKRREQSCCPLRAQCSCPPIADSNWTKSCAKSNLHRISSSLVGGKSFLPKWAGGSRKERLHDLLSFFFQQILCGITYSSDQVVLKICYWLVLGLNLAKTTFQFSKWVLVKIESCKGGQLKVVGQQKWPNDHPDRTGSCRATNLRQKIF